MIEQLIVLGGGGHASDVLATVEGSGQATGVLIADDADVESHRFIGRAEIFGGSIVEACARGGRYVSAIGYPATRRHVVRIADAEGVEWTEAIVHAQSTVHGTARLGLDVVVMGQTWISAWVDVGAHTNIAYGVTIGHDTSIGTHAAVMPGSSISGDVVIGDGVLIGTNATILQGLRIGSDAVVGAGAVVTRDVLPGTTVTGVPARVGER